MMGWLQSLKSRQQRPDLGRGIVCRYFGITDQRFTGGVFSPEFPSHHFHVGLVDETGEVIFTSIADKDTHREEIPDGHGFSLRLPADWLGPGSEGKRYQFKIIETGKLFPKDPRVLPLNLVLSRPAESHRDEKFKAKLISLERIPASSLGKEVLVVGTHEMSRTGAPLIILEIIKQLHTRHGRAIVLLSLAPRGILFEEFSRHCSLVIDDLGPLLSSGDWDPGEFFESLRRKTGGVALINSLCSTKLAVACRAAGFEVKSLVHEYPHAFPSPTIVRHFHASSEVILPCADVRDSFLNPELGLHNLGTEIPKLSVLSQGCYMLGRDPLSPSEVEAFAESFRQQYQISSHDRLVVSCGTIDSRKGFDWFVALICWYATHSPNAGNTHFVWIGRVSDSDLFFHSLHDLRQLGLIGKFHHVDEAADIRLALAMADVFLLCSRIDPFPSVVLESFLLGKPVIGFDKGQGSRDLIRETGFGRVIPYQRLTAAVGAIDSLLADSALRQRIRGRGPELVRSRYQYDAYVDAISDWISGKPIRQEPCTVSPSSGEPADTMPPILLLGFHRSGTSFLSQFLLSIGVNMVPSGNSLGSGPGNPDGHFEDVGILDYHCGLLWRKHKEFMDRWGGKFCIFLPDYEDSWAGYRLGAAKLGRSLGQTGPWGWKDPRTLLFFDLWKSIYPAAIPVMVLRHPLAICLSLLRRGTDSYFLSDPLALFDAYVGYHRAALKDFIQAPDTWFTVTMPATESRLTALRAFLSARLKMELGPMANAAIPDVSRFEALPIPEEIHETFCQMFPEAGEVFDRFSGKVRPDSASESRIPSESERLDWLQDAIHQLTGGRVMFCRDLKLRFRTMVG